MLTLGSLFDGSGGFPLAGTMSGFEPLWASEVEPYPIAVTRSRFPRMLHLGNVCDVSGATVRPVDVITFGSPCQDLSVAGKRAGLKHEDHGDDETTRSGLFMEAVRIITEMREATNGRYPTFAVWENVPGALSSSGGDDFLAVLENLAKIADPEVSIPKPDRWCANGEIVGDGWSIAWRIIDARYFGVTVRDGDTGDVSVRGTPQRRRRIYLVADFRGARAGKILFEFAGVQGNTEPCTETRQGASADAERSVGDAVGTVKAYGIDHVITTGGNCTAQGPCVYEDIEATLKASGTHAVCYGISAYESNAMKSSNLHSGVYEADTSRTLDLNGGNPACNQGGIAVVETVAYNGENITSPTNAANPQPGDPCHTLGTDNRNYIVFAQNQREEVRDLKDRTVALNAQPGTHQQTFIAQPVYSLQGSMIGRADANGPQGDGVNEDVSFTCNTTDRHAVAYAVGNGQADQSDLHDVPGALNCMHDQQAVLVRRLTPTECARLQGFPDDWGHPDIKTELSDEEYAFWTEVRCTHAMINGKEPKTYNREQMLKWYNNLHTDSAEYKMWGNGIALPCAYFVLNRIAKELNHDNQNPTADA